MNGLAERKWFFPAAVAAVLLVYLALAGGSLITKRPYSDEAYQANAALNLITRGTPGNSVVEPTGAGNRPREMVRINIRNYMWLPLPFVIHAGWYKIFGFGIVQVRSVALLAGLIGLIACGVIVNALLQNRWMALAAKAFLALDRLYIEIASDGRPDMLAAAFCFAGIAAQLYLRKRNFTAAIIAGQTLVALGVFTHPIAVSAFFGSWFLAAWLDWGKLRFRHLAIGAIPYLLCLAGWGLYIAQDPEAFVAQFSVNLGGRNASLRAPWAALWREITVRYLENYYLPSYSRGLKDMRVLIPVFYLCAAIGVAVSRELRRTGARTLLLLTGVYFTVMTFGDGVKPHYYTVHILPLLAALMGVWVVWCWTKRPSWRWILGGAVSVFVFLQAGWAIAAIAKDPYHRSYLPAMAFLKRVAPPPAIIMGGSENGFALGYYANLVDDVDLGYYTGKRPQFIIVDERGYGQVLLQYKVLRPDLDAYVGKMLSEDCDKVYDDPPYRIYARKPGH